MLGKLFKYDMKALSRILVPVHLAALALGIIAAICGFVGHSLDGMSVSGSDLQSVLTMMMVVAFLVTLFGVLGLASVVVVTFVVILFRFYKNLFTDEGYLTLTLPATAHQIVLAKLFAGLVWLAVDGIVVALMTLLVSLAASGFVGGSLADSMPYWMMRVAGGDLLGLQDGSALFGLMQTTMQVVEGLMLAYAAFALGASWAARHKVAAGVGLFILFEWAAGLALSIGAVIALFAYALVDSSVMVSWAIYPLNWAFMLGISVAGYFACVHALTCKVNLA